MYDVEEVKQCFFEMKSMVGNIQCINLFKFQVLLTGEHMSLSFYIFYIMLLNLYG